MRMPFRIGSIGICGPMTPVEPMSTESADCPSTASATASEVRRQTSMPSLPVQAFAMPELITTTLVFRPE